MSKAVLPTLGDDPTIKFVECRVTVESEASMGDFTETKRVEFNGYATRELYETIAEAIREVVR